MDTTATVRFTWVIVVAFFLSAALLSREIVDRVREIRRDGIPAPMGVRYAELVRQMPPGARLGYVSDLSDSFPEGSKMYDDAVYSLPPRLVHWGTDEPQVLANLKDPSQLAAICEKHHLHPVHEIAPGLLILEHDAP